MSNRPSTNTIYWTCQLLGWGAAAIYWSRYQITSDYTMWLGIGSVLLSFIAGIGATHLYKVLSHRYGWIHYELKKLILPLFLALIILTIIYLLVAMFSIYIRYGSMDTNTFLGMLTGGVRYNAIWLLAFHLYHYARHSRQAEIDQSNYEKLAIAAQFNQLNTELNPHFLFNSLNSIKALTTENPTAARKAVDLLSALLRSTLHHADKRVVSVREEIQRVEAYLALEKIRFEERLSYTIKIPDELYTFEIIPLSIQNQVENAVKHGIGQSMNGGHILITAVPDSDGVVFRVINDGQLSSDPGTGIGIKNIRKRLELAFGPKANLVLNALSTNQVESRMYIPKIEST